MTPKEHVRRLKRLVRRLRRLLPALLPVRVRLSDAIQGNYVGDCCVQGRGRGRYFQIRLRTDSTFWEHKEILTHEWAHALTWTGNATAFEDHGPLWGVAYSKCYQTVYRVR